MSFTGLPIVREIAAASSAASANRWRPNEPPPSVTCTVTLLSGRRRSTAIRSLARIGDFRHDQISARSLRTSAMAQLVSSGSPGRKWNVNVSSTVLPGSGGVSGSCALRRSASTEASDLPDTDEPLHRTFSALTASTH
jgi:hypothetical protein